MHITADTLGSIVFEAIPKPVEKKTKKVSKKKRIKSVHQNNNRLPPPPWGLFESGGLFRKIDMGRG